MDSNKERAISKEELARQLERQGLATVGAAIDLRKGDITYEIAKRRLQRAVARSRKFLEQLAAASLLGLCALLVGCMGESGATSPGMVSAPALISSCGQLAEEGDGLYRDPRLVTSPPDCEPMLEAGARHRCLPARPYWNFGMLTAGYDFVEIPGGEVFAQPFYVVTVDPAMAVSSVLLIRDGAQACTGNRCALRVPHNVAVLTVPLETFTPCN
jgi:hypothetical protein